METHISVPVPTSLFLRLVDLLRESDSDNDPVRQVSDAIEYWIDNAAWKPELLNQPATGGYTWKSLYLPHGTDIRMKYRGTYHYARVEGDQVMHNGAPTTPGSFVNTIADSSRNAWRDLWVKRPWDKEWRLAETLRVASADDLLAEMGHDPSSDGSRSAQAPTPGAATSAPIK